MKENKYELLSYGINKLQKIGINNNNQLVINFITNNIIKNTDFIIELDKNNGREKFIRLKIDNKYISSNLNNNNLLDVINDGTFYGLWETFKITLQDKSILTNIIYNNLSTNPIIIQNWENKYCTIDNNLIKCNKDKKLHIDRFYLNKLFNGKYELYTYGEKNNRLDLKDKVGINSKNQLGINSKNVRKNETNNFNSNITFKIELDVNETGIFIRLKIDDNYISSNLKEDNVLSIIGSFSGLWEKFQITFI